MLEARVGNMMTDLYLAHRGALGSEALAEIAIEWMWVSTLRELLSVEH